jgi:type II secretory pathway pseudopilin PulG
MKRQIRFSYLQMLIAAVVLGIAGRMIAPQFTEAAGETKKISGLIDGLEQMRAQLDLYRAHHKDCLPLTDSFEGFEAAMTTRSGRYGPYVGKIPVNPFNGLETVRFDGEPAGAGKAGWRLDTKSGLFQADNDVSYAAL